MLIRPVPALALLNRVSRVCIMRMIIKPGKKLGTAVSSHSQPSWALLSQYSHSLLSLLNKYSKLFGQFLTISLNETQKIQPLHKFESLTWIHNPNFTSLMTELNHCFLLRSIDQSSTNTDILLGICMETAPNQYRFFEIIPIL